MEHLNKKENSDQILIWIIASILFHILLGLILMVFNIHHSLNLPKPTTLPKQDYDHAILMMDQPQQHQQPPITEQTAKQQEPKEEKTKKPESTSQNDPSRNFILIPGKQGLDAQQLSEKDLKSLPKPEEQSMPNMPPLPEKPDIKNQTETPLAKQSETPKTLTQNIKKIPEPIKKEPTHFVDDDPRASMTKKTEEKKVENQNDNSNSSIQETNEFIGQPKPQQFVPQRKHNVSFKDLNLGFNEQYQTVGNTKYLMQNGLSFDVPDAESMKWITLKNQFAETMISAFRSHPQFYLRKPTGKQMVKFITTTNRQGQLIDLKLYEGSKDIILDQIVLESLRSIPLYPQIPTFIKDDIFTQLWVYSH